MDENWRICNDQAGNIYLFIAWMMDDHGDQWLVSMVCKPKPSYIPTGCGLCP